MKRNDPWLRIHNLCGVCVADITSSADIEQCLREAAYMKDFHHPNVIRLIGNTRRAVT